MIKKTCSAQCSELEGTHIVLFKLVSSGIYMWQVMVVYSFNFSTWDIEPGRFL